MEAKPPERTVEQIVAELSKTTDMARQSALKQELLRHPGQYDRALLQSVRDNPFVQMSPQELNEIEMRRRLRTAEEDMLLLRQLAGRLGGPRIAVFCMPKSGSTFITLAIAQALRLNQLTLTSIMPDAGVSSSHFGMNGREQELDEMSLMVQTFRTRGRWVAQHHTRFTAYLGNQINFYGILPIVTVRNLYDCMVSMDDMVMGGRSGNNIWMDPPYALPAHYTTLERDVRLTLLAGDYGVWLVKFLLSWKRAIAAGKANPLILCYEQDILTPASLMTKLSDFLALNQAERAELERFIAKPADEEARFNKGVAGRGDAVPTAARTQLREYAEMFRTELGQDGMDLLFGDN